MKLPTLNTHLVNNLRNLPFRKNKEAVTQLKIIYPILREAGYQSIDMDSVEEEYDAHTGDSVYPIEIDICLKVNGKPFMFVQCKQLGSKHRLKNDYNKTFNAAKRELIPWIVFTDGEVWEFYKLNDEDYELFQAHNLRYDSKKYLEVVILLQDCRKARYEHN